VAAIVSSPSLSVAEAVVARLRYALDLSGWLEDGHRASVSGG
jgi:hypothetical protein